jgi:2-polyprenyl-3-methyl-5-hydroxy-6-metoxy-1,4-benzoquinol methylase
MTNNKFFVITDEIISQVHTDMLRLIDVSEVANNLGQDVDHMNFIFGLVKDEIKQTLSLLKGFQLKSDARILEVGAGYGLASICLAMMGFSVTALEPGGIGFEDYLSASAGFARMCNVHIEHLDSTAETADFSTFEKFDVIISNNVLEHIEKIDEALKNLNNALKPDGFMVHSCANYSFPYEPHYGVPLLPFVPSFTRVLLPKRITQDGIWKSLNFITARQVKRNIRENGMSVVFRSGTMAASIVRLRNEEIFAARHKTLGKIFSINAIYLVVRTVLNLPTSLATPMDFYVCFPGRENHINRLIWQGSLKA